MDLGCKSEFAKLLKVGRTSLYHEYHKQKERDDEDIGKLKTTHIKNPRYGVRRLAIELDWSEDKTRRIRNLANVEALRRKKRSRHSKDSAEIDSPENKLRDYWELRNPDSPRDGYSFAVLTKPELNIWAEDFTYIGWHGRFLYLATTLRLSTREVLGWSLGLYHDTDLVCASLEDALRNNTPPDIAHSDQGPEYLSRKNSNLCENAGIKMSASDKGEPWQNGYMERFFNTFKEEMEHKIRNCKTLSEVYEKIANWIYYYNYERIHTALKMPPKTYAAKLQSAKLLQDNSKKVPKMNASHSLRLPQSAYAR